MKGNRQLREQGEAKRATLRQRFTDRLCVGCVVPSAVEVAAALNMASASEAHRHLRRVLSEDGIRTEIRQTDRGARRLYVTSRPGA